MKLKFILMSMVALVVLSSFTLASSENDAKNSTIETVCNADMTVKAVSVQIEKVFAEKFTLELNITQATLDNNDGNCGGTYFKYVGGKLYACKVCFGEPGIIYEVCHYIGSAS